MFKKGWNGISVIIYKTDTGFVSGFVQVVWSGKGWILIRRPISDDWT